MFNSDFKKVKKANNAFKDKNDLLFYAEKHVIY